MVHCEKRGQIFKVATITLFCVIVHSYFSPSFCPQMDFIKTSSRWCVKLIWEVRLSWSWTLGQCDVSDFEEHVRHTGSSCLVVTTWFLRSYCSSIRGHCCLLGECLVWNGALWKENKCGRRGKRTGDNHDDDNGDDIYYDDVYVLLCVLTALPPHCLKTIGCADKWYQIVSDGKIQMTLLILGRGALSMCVTKNHHFFLGVSCNHL